jgi:acetyl-CoA C-acetyltransferase
MSAAAALWKQAGITSPLDEIDCAEIYVPFSWFEPMWIENLGFASEGEGWKLTESRETEIGGRLPINMSGGVLSSNPIGASGMLRFGEAALQVMGEAGEHQVDGARRALGHAYGGGSQFFAMWVVGSEKPTS